MDDSTTPKFMKTADGYCYVYTDALSRLKHLTPYDGDIDARGMAITATEAPAKKDAPTRPRSKKQAEPEPTPVFEYSVATNGEAEFSGTMTAES